MAPDGSWLASGGDDGTVRIWDAATGQAAGHPDRPHRPGAAVAVAPDGSWLASGGDDGTVRIWDPATGRQRAILTGHTGRVGAVAVAPDGSWLASGGRGRDGADLGRGHRAGAGHPDRPSGPVWGALAVAPDGSWLASAGNDGTVRIWDPATGRARAFMRLDSRLDQLVRLGAQALAVGGSAGLCVFDIVL